jgi:molybdenum cofactor cytidylyltransferase
MMIAAILLAGGESRRMGVLKPLLLWGEGTLIEYQLAQAKAVCDLVVAVLGHRAQEVLPLVHRAGALAVVNELYAEGRAASVRVGAAALGDDVTAVLVLNIDQPRPAGVLSRLAAEHLLSGSLITVPVFEGRRGHPPAFGASLLPELRQVSEASQGLRAVVRRHEREIAEVSFETALVLLDMNRPEEYERARREYFQDPLCQAGAEART